MSHLAGQDINATDFIIELTAGEALTTNDSVYISASDGKAYKTDADDLTKMDFAGFVLLTASINTTVRIKQYGHLDGFSGLTINAPLYESGTAGAVTHTAPTNKRIVGIAVTATLVRIFTGVRRIETQTFTADGTWTKRAGLVWVDVDAQGAGGGGDDVGGGTGGAGGGGSRVLKRIMASALSATETVTVGVGGTFTVAGESTTFGAHVTAAGGAAASGATGGAGGTASGGDVNISGSPGGQGNGGAAMNLGPAGGSSFYGFGAMGVTGGAGAAASGRGGGGGGGYNTSNGGAGTDGILILTEYYG